MWGICGHFITLRKIVQFGNLVDCEQNKKPTTGKWDLMMWIKRRKNNNVPSQYLSSFYMAVAVETGILKYIIDVWFPIDI